MRPGGPGRRGGVGVPGGGADGVGRVVPPRPGAAGRRPGRDPRGDARAQVRRGGAGRSRPPRGAGG
ncbi:hypothetical protein EKG83_10600 [Saccharothrix syringae]|uniref:Uncharacterized protein n=1 Tax=Saccharothrix syringae TaxID=103733 RepID=A0A5Q0GWZ0_SACSY|nr:hypothetical protein EKG83_10600 [Saccharothrix syringae]